jgi:hypothetical protein
MSVGYASANLELHRRIKDMKHLLNGVAIVAALAIAAPVWAQRTGPGVGAPGPNQPVPGGPGPSSPMSNLPPSSSRDLPYPAPPPGAAAAPGSMGDTSSAMPPAHRAARHAGTHHAGKAAHPPSAMAGSSAAQLNQEELARLQSGNFSMPPAPPPPADMSTDNTRGAGRQMRQQNAPPR